jgi:hypothetical protein
MSETMFSDFFDAKYNEFCDDLLGACPEFSSQIVAAKALATNDRKERYKNEILQRNTKRSADVNPGFVLPGVRITDSVWTELSEKTQKAILDYLAILDMFSAFDSFTGADGEMNREWADNILRDWRARLGGVDFKKISEKIMSMFGNSAGGDALPPLPERFLRGKLAKLAEDMVREIKPEDFGISEDDIARCNDDPTRAFEILMQAATQNPENLQRAMQKVARKLQAKIQSGELKPQELAAEAEELMKEFQNHPMFVQMMQSFRDVFSFEDPDVARSAGRDGDGRLALARSRLRKKLEAKKKSGNK